jgi:hypothetical protein
MGVDPGGRGLGCGGQRPRAREEQGGGWGGMGRVCGQTPGRGSAGSAGSGGHSSAARPPTAALASESSSESSLAWSWPRGRGRLKKRAGGAPARWRRSGSPAALTAGRRDVKAENCLPIHGGSGVLFGIGNLNGRGPDAAASGLDARLRCGGPAARRQDRDAW